MKINCDDVGEARLHTHLGNELERNVATSPHLSLLAVRQTRQHPCKIGNTPFRKGTHRKKKRQHTSKEGNTPVRKTTLQHPYKKGNAPVSKATHL